MKTRKLTLVAALLVCSGVVDAQNYSFKVLAIKGTNEVKSGGTWEPLKTGATLNASDEVKLGENAYVGLVHSTGKPVEVKESGVYKVSELETKVPAGGSVLNKYTDFILSSNAETKKNRLSATGAVTREIPSSDAGQIKVFLPENTGIFQSTAVITWQDGRNQGPYVITFKNMFEDILHKAETPENSYSIDLSPEKFANENAILIEVSSKADPKHVSRRHVIKKLSAADFQQISTALNQINGEIKEKNAVNHILMAGFFENNNLLADAITLYVEAIKLEPEAYRESYDDFLLRNNLR